MEINEWSRRKRVVALIVVGVMVAVVTGISIAVIDDYARGEVRRRVQAEYFEQVSQVVLEDVKKKLPIVCNEEAAVRATKRFLAEERRHITLQVHEPDWGWQVERYRFTIQWRRTWIAEFKVDKTHQATIVRWNARTVEKFEDKLKDAICEVTCVGCAFGRFLGLL